MVYLKPLYNRLDARAANFLRKPSNTMSKYYFSKCHTFLSKSSGLTNIEFYEIKQHRRNPEAVVVIEAYCLLIFKACRLWHPNLDCFASNVIKLYLLPSAFDNYLYIAWKHIS